MLVDVAQQIKPPKQMTLDRVGISSIVRLKRLDDACGLCGYSPDTSSKLTGIRSIKNWEIGAFGVGTSSQGRQCPDQMVQGSSEAIEDIPSDERKAIRGIFDLDAKSIPLIFGIDLSLKFAGFRFKKGIHLLPQIIKVFIRPSCFQIGITQVHIPESNSITNG